MLIDWIARVFGGRREQTKKSVTPAAPPKVPLPKMADTVENFDLGAIAEYDLRLRKDLQADEGGRVKDIAKQVQASFREREPEPVPFLPLAQRLVGMLNESCDMNVVVQLVQREPIISAQLLKAANSAQYAGLRELNGVREVVMRIGSAATANIALAVAMQTLHDRGAKALQRTYSTQWRSLWLHCLTVSIGSAWLAMNQPKGDVQRAFVAGMFHDIGKTVALRILSDLSESGKLSGLSIPLVEAVLDEVHDEIGGEIAARWQLPAHVVSICRSHHDVSLPPDEVDSQIVMVVSGLDEIRANPFHRFGTGGMARRGLVNLRLDVQQLRMLVLEIQDAAAKADASLGPQRATHK